MTIKVGGWTAKSNDRGTYDLIYKDGTSGGCSSRDHIKEILRVLRIQRDERRKIQK